MSARRLGRALAGGIKGSAVAGGSGVATYFAHKMAASKLNIVQNNPIATPVVMMVLGHVLKRKAPTVSAGLIGAGGYALGLAIDVKRSQQNQTAALVEPSEVAALTEPQDVGDFLPYDSMDYTDGNLTEDEEDVDYSEAMSL